MDLTLADLAAIAVIVSVVLSPGVVALLRLSHKVTQISALLNALPEWRGRVDQRLQKHSDRLDDHGERITAAEVKIETAAE